ncbi:hypothetical protein CRG98_012582 [Punica granatum]|uniref:Protein kinase domain-containing protein n=1 Tax=Punica granatum TaxID=22663 RepID=A0A2I0KEW4_PUNGR|nr:hypothetical protein CRG98_012582 [Punica granatum]
MRKAPRLRRSQTPSNFNQLLGEMLTASLLKAASGQFVVVSDITTVESLQFDLAAIQAATGNFSADKKLGEGGFGEVYMGRLLNGQDVAVKKLSRSSDQGAEEFKNEVMVMAELQHRNLVRLLGFCFEGEEKIVIYEYVPNKSLDYILFGLLFLTN